MHGTLKLLGRAALTTAGPAMLAALASYLGWAPGLVDLSDTLLLFLCVAALVAFSPRYAEALYAPQPFGPREYASLGLFDFFLAGILAVTWSARARAGIHMHLYAVDIGLRLAFRFYSIRGTVFLLLAVGYIRETRVPIDRWMKVGRIALAAAVSLGLLALCGKLLSDARGLAEAHDVAPLAPDTDGRP